MRTPYNENFKNLLMALFTEKEADLAVRMPYRPSTLERIAQISGMDQTGLETMLASMCEKGIVCDLHDGKKYLYMLSPLAIGFFEFTMMRTGPNLESKKWAELFHAYMFGDTSFFDANFKDRQKVSIMRALPYEQALSETEHVEILDYEKASHLIESNDLFAVGLCSCRHEKHHLGTRGCDVDMETCTSMGQAAEFLIRNKFARKIDKKEMLDILARSKDLGFTLSADNVKKDPGFICHCCGCCCNLMLGIKETGYNSILVSSSFIAQVDTESCNGCGKCAKACPIDAIQMVDFAPQGDKPAKKAVINKEICLGCGVCALKCKTKAMTLAPRPQKVFHPEDTFERAFLQCLERGTLQNFIFDNPNSGTQGFFRALLGGFLKLAPVKKTLVAAATKSRFLSRLSNS